MAEWVASNFYKEGKGNKSPLTHLGFPEFFFNGCHERVLEIWLNPRAPGLMGLDGGDVMSPAIKADRVL